MGEPSSLELWFFNGFGMCPSWHSGSAWSPLICREIRRIWRRRSADLSCGMAAIFATICLHMTTYYVCIVKLWLYMCFTCMHIRSWKYVYVHICAYHDLVFTTLVINNSWNPEVLLICTLFYSYSLSFNMFQLIIYIYIHYLYAHSSPVPFEAASPRQPRSPCPARIAPHSIPMSPKSNTAMHKLIETTTPMQPMHVLLT